MTYMVQGQRWEHKRHINQLKRRFTVLVSPRKEVPNEILYDMFDVPTLPEISEPRRYSKRKRTATEHSNIEPKLKRYTPGEVISKWGRFI